MTPKDKFKELLEMGKDIRNFHEVSFTQHLSKSFMFSDAVVPLIELLLKAEEALKTAQQSAMETIHAQENGASWYTKRETGLYQQVRRWSLQSSKEAAQALSSIESFRKGE